MDYKLVDCNDTIVAQTTPHGQGGVGILRVSGPKAKEVAKEVLGKIPQPRYASCLSFKDINGTVLDRGIALWFPGPNSFTGEDVLELQGHGSPVILDMLLERILKLSGGIRIAKPGEFSERAFLNSKIDLLQAEAIADLVEANSRKAAQSSLNSLQGAFSKSINYLINAVSDLRAYVEASIDFPEEGIDFLSDGKIEIRLNKLINYLNEIRSKAQLGSLLRKGIKVVIAGYPNAGKSSLLNALARREVAIITNIAGTTRDILQEQVNFDGILIHIVDTAGLRTNSNDEIERIGIKRTWEEIKQADHVLFVVDATTTKLVNLGEIWPGFINCLPSNSKVTLVRNKIDVTGEIPGISLVKNQTIVRLSANTGDGINVLCDHLKQSAKLDIGVEGVFLARRRHLLSLEKAAFHLKNGKLQLKDFLSFELFAEELRLAQKNLNEITGTNISDDLLKEIFSRFCVGK